MFVLSPERGNRGYMLCWHGVDRTEGDVIPSSATGETGNVGCIERNRAGIWNSFQAITHFTDVTGDFLGPRHSARHQPEGDGGTWCPPSLTLTTYFCLPCCTRDIFF